MLLKDKLKWWFLENINWCHPVMRDGTPKKPTWFYTAYCWMFWPIPWQKDPCWCCASFRGLITGFAAGVLLGVLL